MVTLNSKEKERIIYMDHASTSQMYEEVYQAMIPFLSIEYGNPSSVITPGIKAAALLDEARNTIADFQQPAKFFRCR